MLVFFVIDNKRMDKTYYIRGIIMKNTFLILFLISLFHWTYAQTQSIFDDIEVSMGGKNTWNNTDYLYYSASGNSSLATVSQKRSFLINKSNGDARFKAINDKNQEVVILFNYLTPKVKKIFIEQVEKDPSDSDMKELYSSVQKQLAKDLTLLFSPISVIDHANTQQTPTPKIIDGKKLSMLSVSNMYYPSHQESISGTVGVDPKGKIHIIELQNGAKFWVDKYIDTGGGLVLPTQFESEDKVSHSCVFSTVASFTDIEKEKFEKL